MGYIPAGLRCWCFGFKVTLLSGAGRIEEMTAGMPAAYGGNGFGGKAGAQHPQSAPAPPAVILGDVLGELRASQTAVEPLGCRRHDGSSRGGPPERSGLS